jgi:hypothetical protein
MEYMKNVIYGLCKLYFNVYQYGLKSELLTKLVKVYHVFFSTILENGLWDT